MDTAIYLQMNLIPILALLVMRTNAGYTLPYSWRSRALRFMMVLLTGALAANIIGRYFDGKQIFGTRIFLWMSNAVCLGFLVFMSYVWYLYTRDVVENGMGQSGSIVWKSAIPLLVFVLLLLSSPWTRAIFYLNDQNFYVRGDGYVVYVLVAFGYVLSSSICALYHGRREEQLERRNECRMLGWFAALPVCGGVLQILYPSVEFAVPFTVASVLMVYLDVQQRQVIRDALTGLNNRGRLEQYFLELEKQDWENAPCHLLLMDIDKFKRINDKFGHMTGDFVLKLVAEQLKKTFGRTNSFLARYGGDEFVVILKGKSDKEVEEQLRALREGIASVSWGEGDTWKLAVSVGCAKSSEAAHRDIRVLLELADARMYEEKKRNRQK